LRQRAFRHKLTFEMRPASARKLGHIAILVGFAITGGMLVFIAFSIGVQLAGYELPWSNR
jgi:hypothetical protein